MTSITTSSSPEQLTLLPEASVPVQFRLDEAELHGHRRLGQQGQLLRR